MDTDPNRLLIHRIPDPIGRDCDSRAGGVPNFGLSCAVLCHADGSDATLGGITSTATRAVLTDPLHVRRRRGLPCDEPLGMMAPSLDPTSPRFAPELQLRLRKGTLIACPPDAQADGSPYAFGGNFVFTSDDRLPEQRPIPVHDRDLRRERDESWRDPAAPMGRPRGLRLEKQEVRDSAVGARLAAEDWLADGFLVRIYPVDPGEGGEPEFRWFAEGFCYRGRYVP